MELFSKDAMITVGASHGWVATLKEDGVLRLQDDLNPVASDTDPKRIPLPPLVTLPHCQTQIVTNMAMSTPSPEDEDCVVAIKFLGPQLSFCRPAHSNPEWTNIKIENPCFFSSRVMYSKKDDMFRIPGSGGHLIGSWDPRTHENKPQLEKLLFTQFPNMFYHRQLLHCCTSDHLVESRPTGETFLVKWYRKTYRKKLITKAAMVFKLSAEGVASHAEDIKWACHTEDIGGVRIFLSKSEPFCVPASSIFNRWPHFLDILDVDETGGVFLDEHFRAVNSTPGSFGGPYHIPPQNIDL